MNQGESTLGTTSREITLASPEVTLEASLRSSIEKTHQIGKIEFPEDPQANQEPEASITNRDINKLSIQLPVYGHGYFPVWLTKVEGVESIEGDVTVDELAEGFSNEMNACVGLKSLYTPKNSYYRTRESIPIHDSVLYKGVGSLHYGKQSKGSRHAELSLGFKPSKHLVLVMAFEQAAIMLDTRQSNHLYDLIKRGNKAFRGDQYEKAVNCYTRPQVHIDPCNENNIDHGKARENYLEINKWLCSSSCLERSVVVLVFDVENRSCEFEQINELITLYMNLTDHEKTEAIVPEMMQNNKDFDLCTYSMWTTSRRSQGSVASLSSLVNRLGPILRNVAPSGSCQVINPVEGVGYMVVFDELLSVQNKAHELPNILVAKYVREVEKSLYVTRKLHSRSSDPPPLYCKLHSRDSRFDEGILILLFHEDVAEEAQCKVDLFISDVHIRNNRRFPTSEDFKRSLNLDDVRRSFESVKVEFMSMRIDNMNMDSSPRPDRTLSQSAPISCTRNSQGSRKLMGEIVVGLDDDVGLIRDKLVEDQKNVYVVSIVGT
ncbi:hypothetical protein L1987_58335 [Smallanthus sonchifolius]|uniref:Uncharacterized protein n=1 Tax=Smallanthus sonchifolius TaxID=185202 RepID=A0ACB9DG12_9ASTR|nr:hypothetical protein L1987_58335 [Smallanthus sonchifolius]